MLVIRNFSMKRWILTLVLKLTLSFYFFADSLLYLKRRVVFGMRSQIPELMSSFFFENFVHAFSMQYLEFIRLELFGCINFSGVDEFVDHVVLVRRFGEFHWVGVVKKLLEQFFKNLFKKVCVKKGFVLFKNLPGARLRRCGPCPLPSSRALSF